MLDLFTLLGAVGLESEVLKARETVTGRSRGNIFNHVDNQAASDSTSVPAEEDCGSIHKLVLSLLSVLPDTPALDVPKPSKTA